MAEESQSCFEGSLVTQIRAQAQPGLFDCVMENRLLCGFLVLSSFCCFYVLHFLTWSTRAVQSDYIWPTLCHSSLAYSRVNYAWPSLWTYFLVLCWIMVGTSSLANLGYTARIFMAGYVHNGAFQDFEYVWTEAHSSKSALISARKLIPFCRHLLCNCPHTVKCHTIYWLFHFGLESTFPIRRTFYFAVRFTYQLLWKLVFCY